MPYCEKRQLLYSVYHPERSARIPLSLNFNSYCKRNGIQPHYFVNHAGTAVRLTSFFRVDYCFKSFFVTQFFDLRPIAIDLVCQSSTYDLPMSCKPLTT
jgi:hypothetical protein